MVDDHWKSNDVELLIFFLSLPLFYCSYIDDKSYTAEFRNEFNSPYHLTRLGDKIMNFRSLKTYHENDS